MVDRHQLDYRAGNGSGTYEGKKTDVESPDSEKAVGDVGATTFDPHEANPSKEERFVELRKRHHGHFDLDGDEEMNKTDIAYDARMVCNRLELSDVQQVRAIKVIKASLPDGNYRYERTIMASVSYVLNEGGRWIQRTDGPHSDPLSDVYYDILDSFEIDESRVREHRNEIADGLSDVERL